MMMVTVVLVAVFTLAFGLWVLGANTRAEIKRLEELNND
jgi:hypothetical protein